MSAPPPDRSAPPPAASGRPPRGAPPPAAAAACGAQGGLARARAPTAVCLLTSLPAPLAVLRPQPGRRPARSSPLAVAPRHGSKPPPPPLELTVAGSTAPSPETNGSGESSPDPRFPAPLRPSLAGPASPEYHAAAPWPPARAGAQEADPSQPPARCLVGPCHPATQPSVGRCPGLPPQPPRPKPNVSTLQLKPALCAI
nr:basic proline-rich protein-like [Aegilops tauschii subsp. strangulata]